MAAADAKAIVPSLEVVDDIPGQAEKLLKALGEWCIRYTPLNCRFDLPDGLILDISGCAHLWGGERAYLGTIIKLLPEAKVMMLAAQWRITLVRPGPWPDSRK